MTTTSSPPSRARRLPVAVDRSQREQGTHKTRGRDREKECRRERERERERRYGKRGGAEWRVHSRLITRGEVTSWSRGIGAPRPGSPFLPLSRRGRPLRRAPRTDAFRGPTGHRCRIRRFVRDINYKYYPKVTHHCLSHKQFSCYIRLPYVSSPYLVSLFCVSLLSCARLCMCVCMCACIR